MISTLLITLALVIGLLLILGSPRIHIARQAGIEGIDDLEAARAYDLVSRMPPFIFLRQLVVSKLAQRSPTGVLADIGCGPGYLATLIGRRFSGLSVIGVDASDEMVRAGSVNAAEKGLSDRVAFRKGDVASLPFEDGELDIVLSTLSLHHWADTGKAFSELRRVLKPGGWALIFDLRRDARRRYLWLMQFVTSVIAPAGLRRIREPLGSLLSSYTPTEVEVMLHDSPLDDWEIEGGDMWMFIWMKT
jgi:ubiquinone/menaquinone biosynthesis C-methylase UbiE